MGSRRAREARSARPGGHVTDTWYFAYGSNLFVDQKVLRTGAIRKPVRCRLPGYRFVFNKRARSGDGVYANVVPDDSATVWGVACLCNEAAIAELDGYEGVSGGDYRHQHVGVVTDEGEALHALTYVAGDDYVCEEGRPRADYLDAILDGARHHGLPEDYVASIEALGGGRGD
jgi:gamma-glutamylcyclotransferase